MSADTSDNHPLAKILGNVFLVLVPGALIVMLGYIGYQFVSGIGPEKKPEAAATPVAVASTPAPDSAPAPAAPSSTDPAATPPAAPADGGSAAAVDPAVMALGKASYMTCAACHGPDGTGLKVGPALMAPSLVGSELLLGDPNKSLLVVLKGIAKENMDFMGVMAPLGAALDDQKLAAVLTYTRNEWGNSAPPVTVEQAAAARAKFAALNAPAGVKRAEVDAVIEAHK